MNNKILLIKSGYFVEMPGSGGKKVIWGVVDNHGIEEPKGNGDIGIRGFVLVFW